MKRLLPLLLWIFCVGLASCDTLRNIPYTPLPRAPHAVMQSLWLRNEPDSTRNTGFTLEPTGSVLVVGYTSIWAVVRFDGRRYFVRSAGLSQYPLGYYAYYNTSPYYTGGGGVPHDTYTGPRGGQYYINGNGNKTYVTPQSTIDYQPVQTGPRGGQYYINDSGRKTYIKH